MATKAWIAALGLVMAGPLAAQETRVAEAGQATASCHHRRGRMVDRHMERCTGINVGRGARRAGLPAFGQHDGRACSVQETTAGGIMFSEHMYLPGCRTNSLVVKLKHFNPDLTGWEDH